MSKILLIINIILLTSTTFIYGVKVSIDKIELEESDSDYLKVATNIRKEGGENVIDIDAELLQDLEQNVFMQIHIEKKIDGQLKTLYKSDLVDQCHFIENKDKYPQVRMLVEDIKKYGNMMQPCPIKKGKYFTKGFKFEPKEDFVHLLSPGEYTLHFAMFRKVEEAMNELYKFKWVATIE